MKNLMAHTSHETNVIPTKFSVTISIFLCAMYFRSLTFHKNSTYFFAHSSPTNYSRLMMFTNTFNFSLVLYNVTLPIELKDIFSVSS